MFCDCPFLYCIRHICGKHLLFFDHLWFLLLFLDDFFPLFLMRLSSNSNCSTVARSGWGPTDGVSFPDFG